MRTLLVLCLLPLAAPAFGQSLSGVSLNTASGPVVAHIDCWSQTGTAYDDGDVIPLTYGQHITCKASDSTVNGVAINDTGWVPETLVTWTWGDDNGLGTVSRGGRTVSLSSAVGVVATTAFLPTTYGESCGVGGDKSLQTVTVKVTSIVGGARETDTETVSVCVEKRENTWPTPVAFCDDSNCADDAGVPAGTVHGGNGTNLATILDYCDTNGSERILVEGGVTFTTSSSPRMGVNPCLIESYGSGRAKLRLTGTSNGIATSDGCAGVTFHDVQFAGDGTIGDEMIGGQAAANGSTPGVGCLTVVDADVSPTAGDEIYRFTVDDHNATSHVHDMAFIKVFVRNSRANESFHFIDGDRVSWVGGEIGDHAAGANAHALRCKNCNSFVVDAMLFHNHHSANNLLTIRQDCGGVGSCTNHADMRLGSVVRSEFRAKSGGASPMNICSDGSSDTEQTKCYDIDVTDNVFVHDETTDASQPTHHIFFQLTSNAATRIERTRFYRNAFDMSHTGTSGTRRPFALSGSGQVNDIDFKHNIAYCGLTCGTATYGIWGATLPGNSGTPRNNVLYTTAGTRDMFPNVSETADNITVSSDPFDRVGGDPATGVNFGFDDLLITSSAALKGQGVSSLFETDIEGEAIPQSSDYDAGVDDE